MPSPRGRLDLLADLRAAGATVRPISDAETLTGLLLAGDSAAVDAFIRAHPDALRGLLRGRPALVHKARTAAGGHGDGGRGF